MRKKIVIYEVVPRDNGTEDVMVFGVLRKWYDQCMAELVIRSRGHYPFFCKYSKEFKQDPIEYYKKKSKEYWDAVKEKVEDGELTPKE